MSESAINTLAWDVWRGALSLGFIRDQYGPDVAEQVYQAGLAADWKKTQPAKEEWKRRVR